MTYEVIRVWTHKVQKYVSTFKEIKVRRKLLNILKVIHSFETWKQINPNYKIWFFLMFNLFSTACLFWEGIDALLVWRHTIIA